MVIIRVGDKVPDDIWGGNTDFCDRYGPAASGSCCLRQGHVRDGSEPNVHVATSDQVATAVWNVDE